MFLQYFIEELQYNIRHWWKFYQEIEIIYLLEDY